MAHDHYTIHCDGACRGNPGPASWGAVVQRPDGSISEIKGFISEHATNQVAELVAAIESLLRTPKGSRVHLVSDSQYVIKGLREWVRGWERRGWRTSSGAPVANEMLWHKLRELERERRVQPIWIKGHNGHPMNVRADFLANEALRTGQQAA